MRLSWSIILLAVAALPALAQFQDVTKKIRAGAETRHLYRGVERAGENAFVALDVGGEQLSAGVALYQPFESDEPRDFNLGAAYAWKLRPDLAAEFSARHFWFGDAVGRSIDRSFELGAALAWTTPGGFVPRLGYYRDLELQADSVHASLAYEVALTKWGTYLELAGFAGWSEARRLRMAASGIAVRDSYTYFGGEATLPYRVGELTVVSASLYYSTTNGQRSVWSPAGRGGGDRVGVRVQVQWEW